MILLYIFFLCNTYMVSTARRESPSSDVNENLDPNSISQRGNRDGKCKYNCYAISILPRISYENTIKNLLIIIFIFQYFHYFPSLNSKMRPVEAHKPSLTRKFHKRKTYLVFLGQHIIAIFTCTFLYLHMLIF